MNEAVKRKCTMLSNLILTLMVMYGGFASWLFDEVDDATLNIEQLSFLKGSMIKEVSFGIVHFVLIILFGTLIIHQVWNRAITNLVSTKEMRLSEAYAIFMLLSLFGSFF